MAKELWQEKLHKGWESVQLDGKELLAVAQWISAHVCQNDEMPMRITIAQSGSSGIGTNTIVRCQCGLGTDVTDYASW